jgi:peroxiredoxin
MNPKNLMLRTIVLLSTLFLACSIGSPHAWGAEIGSKIPNYQLPDASGEIRSLPSVSSKATAIVFWAFKCPVALAYVDRVEELRKKYEGKGVQVLAIASGTNETPEEVRANIANLKVSIPVLLDSEGNVAKKLGATHSPSVFIIDSTGTLRYKGAFDNSKRRDESGRLSYTDDALDSILAGREVQVPETRPFGCSIRLAKETR